MADFVTKAVLVANVANFVKGMQDANKSYDDLVSKAEKSSGVAVGAWDKVGARMKTVGVAMNVGLTAPLLSFAAKSVQAAADAQAMQAQFEQTFGDMATAAQNSLDTIAKETGMLPNRIKPSFSLLTGFAKTAGMDTSEALGLAERATRAAADSAAYYDRSMEDATESLMSFLKGNYANDAALGISATATTRNAKANELYGESFNDLSEAQKQLTLLAMVEDGNKLSGALGQAAREADGLVNVTGNLKQAFTDASAELGKELLPVVTDVLKEITNLVKGFSELPDGVKKGIVSFGIFATAAGPLLTTGGKVIDIFQKIGRQKAAADAISKTGEAAKEATGKIGLGGKMGLVGAGIALVAVLGVEAYEAITRTSDSVKKLADEADQAGKAFAEQSKNIESNAVSAKGLADQVFELAEAENKTSEQKQLLAGMVDELNKLVPDLSLNYDAQTDSLNHSREAIYKHIEAMKQEAETAAYQEEIIRLTKERALAEAEYESAGKKLSEIEQRPLGRFSNPLESNQLLNDIDRTVGIINNANEKITLFQDKLAGASQIIKKSGDDAVEAADKGSKAADVAVKATGELTEYQQDTIKQFRALGGEWAAMSDAEILAFQNEINASNDRNEALSNKEQELVGIYKACHEEAITMTDQTILAIAQSEKKAQEEREKSYKEHLQRMNGAAIEQQQVDLDTLTANMKANAKTMEAYYANRLEIQKRMQGREYDGLREWLLSLGAENTNALDEILGMTDEQLQEYAATFQRNMNAAAIFADRETMAAVNNISNRLADGGVTVGEDATELTRSIIAAFNDLGSDLDLKTAEGIAALAKAIADNSGLPEEEAKALKDSINQILGGGEGLEAEAGGRLDAEGYGKGLAEGTATAAESAREVRRKAQWELQAGPGGGDPAEGGRQDAANYAAGISSGEPEAVSTAKSVKDESVNALEGESEATEKGVNLSKGFTDSVEGATTTAEVVGAHLGTKLLFALEKALRGGMTTSTPQQMGMNTAQGIIDGLNGQQNAAYAAGAALANAVNSGYKEALQIKSPSRIMIQDGKNTAEGAVLGIKSQFNAMRQASAALAETVKNNFQTGPLSLPNFSFSLFDENLMRTAINADNEGPHPSKGNIGSALEATIKLSLGSHEYSVFVDDLFKAQDQKLRLEDSYAL